MVLKKKIIIKKILENFQKCNANLTLLSSNHKVLNKSKPI